VIIATGTRKGKSLSLPGSEMRRLPLRSARSVSACPIGVSKVDMKIFLASACSTRLPEPGPSPTKSAARQRPAPTGGSGAGDHFQVSAMATAAEDLMLAEIGL